METNKMLDIIHKNCKKEQLRKHNEQVVNELKKRQQHYSRLNKILVATGIICITIEVAVLIIERMI